MTSWRRICVLVLLCGIGTAAAQGGTDPADVQCILSKCSQQAYACVADAGCQAAQACFQACQPGDFDCTNPCFFQYSNDLFGDLAACAAEGGCTPTQAGNQTCPDFSARPLAAGFNVSMLAEVGTMHVAAGSTAFYDCFPCQTLEFSPAAGREGVATVWSALLPGVGVRNATYILEQAGEGIITTTYDLFGMPLEETYYILDFTEDLGFIFYYYCGYMLGSEYQGALIYSRDVNATVPDDVAARFARAAADSGLDAEGYVVPLDQWCVPEYPQDCPTMMEGAGLE